MTDAKFINDYSTLVEMKNAMGFFSRIWGNNLTRFIESLRVHSPQLAASEVRHSRML
jgi:hypothetical protein